MDESGSSFFASRFFSGLGSYLGMGPSFFNSAPVSFYCQFVGQLIFLPCQCIVSAIHRLAVLVRPHLGLPCICFFFLLSLCCPVFLLGQFLYHLGFLSPYFFSGILGPLHSVGHPWPIPFLHSHGFFAKSLGLPRPNYHILYSWGLSAFALTPFTNSFSLGSSSPSLLAFHFLQFPWAYYFLLQGSLGPICFLQGIFTILWVCVPLFLSFGSNGFFSCFANSSFFTLCYILGFFLALAILFFCQNGPQHSAHEHMNCSCGSYANKKSFLFSFFFSGFFEQWALPYFLSCCEQCCDFKFPSLAVILKHSFCFINTMLLLMADPLHPFTSPLLSLVLKLIPFPSFVQNVFSFPFFFTVSSSSNILTHLFRPNISL